MKRLLKSLVQKFVSAAGIREIVREEVNAAIIQQLRNIDYGLHLRSIQESADFVYRNIPLHLRFTQYELRKASVDLAPAEGMFLEFGVYRGYWICQFAEMTSRPEYYPQVL